MTNTSSSKKCEFCGYIGEDFHLCMDTYYENLYPIELSIVVPTYNEEKCLPLLLNSIKLQSFKNYEVIVADNNSTDMTVKIAEQFGAKVVAGGLPGKARNCGAAAAQGKLILFLDADVILPYPYFLDNIIPEFHEKKYGAATCHIMPLSNDERDIRIHEWYNVLIVMASKIKPFAPGFCILIDHHIHDMINGFDEEIKLTEDSDYVQRAVKFGKFGFLKSNIVYVSVRRFKTDGYFNVIAKYFLAGFYMLLIGKIKTNIFNYKFGHHEDKK